MDAFSIALSIALQYGVPLETFISKYVNTRFEPAGMTDDPDVRMSNSIIDYMFRRLAIDHLDFDSRSALGIHTTEERNRQLETGSYLSDEFGDEKEDVVAAADAISAVVEKAKTADKKSKAHTSAELLEAITGYSVDAPLCATCGTKMRPSGSCYCCEGCGATSGCS